MSVKDILNKLPCKIEIRTNCKGYNAATIKGMSSGGWGYWVWAFRQVGIKSGAMNYWSGSAPTPSTAIYKDIADYIYKNAPKGII